MNPRNEIAISRLHELLICDADSGVLRWRHQLQNGIPAGSRAGCLTSRGYRQVTVDKRLLLEHRVVFAMVHGRWPLLGIDHANGVRDDNRVSNLREATQSQNMGNMRKHKTSVLKGVYRTRPGGCFAARIGFGKDVKRLGFFRTAEEAHAAYVRAAVERFGEFARAA